MWLTILSALGKLADLVGSIVAAWSSNAEAAKAIVKENLIVEAERQADVNAAGETTADISTDLEKGIF